MLFLASITKTAVNVRGRTGQIDIDLPVVKQEHDSMLRWAFVDRIQNLNQKLVPAPSILPLRAIFQVNATTTPSLSVVYDSNIRFESNLQLT